MSALHPQQKLPENQVETEGPPSSDCEDGEADLNLSERSIQGPTPQYEPQEKFSVMPANLKARH